MENILTSSTFSKRMNDRYNSNEEPVFFDFPFSELDILELQNKFLTFGLHHIKTTNVQSGRSMVATILKSLNYYQNVGSITQEGGNLFESHDIYQQVKYNESYNEENLSTALELFFTVNPHFDFVWIELTKELKNINIAMNIEKVFKMCHADERLPVILLSYEKN